MGMDVAGKRPRSEAGKYFCKNLWSWSPLAYCCAVAPEITQACKYWQSNDGDGLDDVGAIALANTLEREIRSDRTALYEKAQAAVAKILCNLCAGSGIRFQLVRAISNDGGIPCNRCQGDGYVTPIHTQSPFSAENVKEFVTFLRECGGLEIW
jgi:hypothetical protein